jgi:hypothetical protein
MQGEFMLYYRFVDKNYTFFYKYLHIPNRNYTFVNYLYINMTLQEVALRISTLM